GSFQFLLYQLIQPVHSAGVAYPDHGDAASLCRGCLECVLWLCCVLRVVWCLGFNRAEHPGPADDEIVNTPDGARASVGHEEEPLDGAGLIWCFGDSVQAVVLQALAHGCFYTVLGSSCHFFPFSKVPQVLMRQCANSLEIPSSSAHST